MTYAQRRAKRSRRKLSEIGKNKPNLYEDENDWQITAASVYKKDKKRAHRFKVDHEWEDGRDITQKKK